MLLDRRNQNSKNEVGILDMFLKARDKSYENHNDFEDFFDIKAE